jgi:methionyl-tRNA formyltransferase
VLQALLDAGIDVVAVLTRPDKRRGRGSAVDASPVKKVALQHGITVFDAPDDALTWMQARDMVGLTGVVVAYGRIIRDPLLSALPLVNLHFSELPRWRGAAPVERAILAGDKRTAASIMQIEEGLDTGAVYAMEFADIHDDDDVTTLRERLADLGARSLVAMLKSGFPAPRAQEGEPLHADKITVDDLRVDWTASAVEIRRTVRLGEAFTSFRGQRFKIRRADVDEAKGTSATAGEILVVDKQGAIVATGSGALRLVAVQPEGKKVMSGRDWANGAQPRVGEVFGSDYGAVT